MTRAHYQGRHMSLPALTGRYGVHVLPLLAGLLVGMTAPIVWAQSTATSAVAPAPLRYADVVEEARALVRADIAERGYPGIAIAVAVDGEPLSPAALLARLNELGGAHGVGRLDLLENRFIGMKSRGIYETPGGTVLHAAHRGIESITLERGAAHLKDELMPRYAELVYNGFWFAPEREMLQAAIDKSQEHVEGTVRLKLYKGSVSVVGRTSPKTLYSLAHVTFEADDVYDQADAEGFIKLNALRLKLLKSRRG